MSRPSDPELVAALEGATGRAVRGFARRESPYRNSYALEELEVEFDDGDSARLMFKDLSPESLRPESRAAKPAFLLDPRREIDVYRVLAGSGHLAATCIATVADEPIGRYWLFMERFDGVELYQVGARTTWEYVARRLARAHGGAPPPASAPPSLLAYDGDYLRTWAERALRHCDAPARPILGGIVEAHGEVLARLEAQPRVLLHGELYASHVLVDDPTDPSRVCAVDWEMAGIGPALLDLAAHASGSWSEPERRSIALAYHAELAPQGRWSDTDTFLADLEACRLQLALQWLGWSDTWSAPPEHAFDWLAEAARAAEALGL